MWHIRVFAKPVGWLDLFTHFVEDPACRLRPVCLRLFRHFRYQRMAVFVIRHSFVVYEEIDTGSKEVHG